jgi:hypothetical protein
MLLVRRVDDRGLVGPRVEQVFEYLVVERLLLLLLLSTARLMNETDQILNVLVLDREKKNT